MIILPLLIAFHAANGIRITRATFLVTPTHGTDRSSLPARHNRHTTHRDEFLHLCLASNTAKGCICIGRYTYTVLVEMAMTF